MKVWSLRFGAMPLYTLMLGCMVPFVGASADQEPVLTVIMVADQFAYHYLPKLQPHLRYGLGKLLTKGVCYHNAFHAHGVPETTTGHHALGTGTLPKDHGAVLNQWLLPDGTKVSYDHDVDQRADQNGLMCTKSCQHTRVDGLSDQFVMASGGDRRHHAWALSLKSYPALITASRLGKALWFDEVSGQFVGNAHHFTQLPLWTQQFNASQGWLKSASQIAWPLAYPRTGQQYQYPDIDNYRYAGAKSFVAAGGVPIDRTTEKSYELFVKTPRASKLLLDLARACIKATLTSDQDRLVLWVCLSNLDLSGHLFGPYSRECIDTIYHLDKQIGDFMRFCKRHVGLERCLFVLTADHGICPIPEIAREQGITGARRMMAGELITKANDAILQQHGVADLLLAYEPTYFVLNRKALAGRNAAQRKLLVEAVCAYLRTVPGIKNVWTRQQLVNGCFQSASHEYFYQKQLYGNRMGDIIVQTDPYCLLTSYPTGTSHSSPYAYDTQVPLVLYQKRFVQRRQVYQRVYIPQMAPTVARLLGIMRPSASQLPLLPGVWEDLP